MLYKEIMCRQVMGTFYNYVVYPNQVILGCSMFYATLLSSLVSGAGRTAERTVTSRSCCFAMASTPARRALALALESSTRAPPRNSADSNLSTQIFCRGMKGTGMVQPLTFRPASEHVRRTRRVPERPRLGPGSEVVARDAEACLPAGSGWRGCRRRRHLD